MGYSTHSGISHAVFYEDSDDDIGKPGEVETEEGEIKKIKIGKEGEWEEFSEELSFQFHRISFYVPTLFTS